MADSIEKEEFADHERLHQHHEGCGNNCEKADDVAHSNDVKDCVSWTCQGALEEWHCGRFWR